MDLAPGAADVFGGCGDCEFCGRGVGFWCLSERGKGDQGSVDGWFLGDSGADIEKSLGN